MDCEEWGVCEAVSSHGAKLRRTGINTSSAPLFEFGSAGICENTAQCTFLFPLPAGAGRYGTRNVTVPKKAGISHVTRSRSRPAPNPPKPCLPRANWLTPNTPRSRPINWHVCCLMVRCAQHCRHRRKNDSELCITTSPTGVIGLVFFNHKNSAIRNPDLLSCRVAVAPIEEARAAAAHLPIVVPRLVCLE